MRDYARAWNTLRVGGLCPFLQRMRVAAVGHRMIEAFALGTGESAWEGRGKEWECVGSWPEAGLAV